MYTRSDAYVRKLGSWTILAILFFSAVIAIVPVAIVHGSAGTVDLGVVTPSASAPTAYASASKYVNVTAGSDVAKNDCAALPCNAGFLAIQFNTVTFSGSQFQLYLSTNGFSQINFTHGETQDLQYGPTFNVVDLTGTYKAVASGTLTYHIGLVGGAADIVEGPIPTAISNAYKFIKIFDGSSTSVAASLKQISILPGISVTPTSGAAGNSIVVSGGGFPANTVIDILYSFTYYTYKTDTATAVGPVNLTTGINTGSGYFTKSMNAPDTKQSVDTALGLHGNIPITLSAKAEKASLGHKQYATATYNETPRFITEVVSVDNTGKCVSSTASTSCGSGVAGHPYRSGIFYGNDTGATGAITLNGVAGTLTAYPTLNAKVMGSLVIAGNDSYVSSAVTIWIGSTKIGTTTSSSTGLFNVTATIPVLPSGSATVLVQSNNVNYNFAIIILPTLILTPSSGPAGTHVTATAYGFPANKYVSLWWNAYTTSDTNDYYLANGTVSSQGSYNVTIAFTVPHSYGGSHNVDATTTKYKSPESAGTLEEAAGFVTSGTFVVTSTLTLNVTSVNANSKTWIKAMGTGFNPDVEYQMNIDHSAFSAATETDGDGPGGLIPATNGDINVTFPATGYYPGYHIVSFYSQIPPVAHGYVPSALAYFNVTTKGDYLAGSITGFTASIDSLKTTINSLQSTVTTLSSTVSTIASNVGTILTNTNGLSTTLSGLGTQIGQLNTALTSANGAISSISSKLDSITSTVNTISSGVSSIQGNLGTSGTIGTAINNMASQVSSTQSSVNSASTYVLVVAVLAAITLVLELAILVRKLS